MATEKYMELLLEVATEHERMSRELFRLAHRLEDMPRYNPRNEMYSLVRNAEQTTVNLRGLAARTGKMRIFYMKRYQTPWELRLRKKADG